MVYAAGGPLNLKDARASLQHDTFVLSFFTKHIIIITDPIDFCYFPPIGGGFWRALILGKKSVETKIM